MSITSESIIEINSDWRFRLEYPSFVLEHRKITKPRKPGQESREAWQFEGYFTDFGPLLKRLLDKQMLLLPIERDMSIHDYFLQVQQIKADIVEAATRLTAEWKSLQAQGIEVHAKRGRRKKEEAAG